MQNQASWFFKPMDLAHRNIGLLLGKQRVAYKGRMTGSQNIHKEIAKKLNCAARKFELHERNRKLNRGELQKSQDVLNDSLTD